ncbi:amidohydrolase [Nitzschia inconspicua]|uniref:Amidohydrolase n=1 Tax=Nitzschia inconspicua TaxID=303405 RepID=A0A9K3KIE8_9STRA|nr:amidohydrolase [Nitzschia inconspicua]
MNDTTTKLPRVAALRQALKEATKPVSLSPSTSSSESTTVHPFLLLKNVSIPIAVLPKNINVIKSKEDNSQSLVSEEGLVLCHVWIRNGKIHKVTTTTSSSSTDDDQDVVEVDDNDNAKVVDCQRSLLMPCFVDCHTHLDKTWTVSRTRNKSGTMDEAWLHKEPSDWKHWTLDDLTRRMRFAVQCAIYYGTKALRTHLDGYNCGEDHALEEQLRNNVYNAYTAIKEAYQDQITLQVVANLYLPLYYSHPDLARAHCSRAKQVPGAVLGAYIGNTTQTPEDDTCQHLDAMLDLAAEFDMDIDLHIDESNDPHCCALRPLCRSLLKARQKGYQGNVVLGHCCALSLQDDDTKTFICTQLAQLGNVYVVANPFTNLSLQDRRGTKPPLGVEIPAENPRTPQWRGVTLLQELRQAGVMVASASDNVRDFWLSAGSDYDMLSVWSTTQAVCHLDTAPNEGSWADIVTICPAMAMGLMKNSESPLDGEQTADFVLFPGARYASELFSRPHIDRIVIRKGIILESQLPDYAELDDLMEVANAEKGNPNKKPKA